VITRRVIARHELAQPWVVDAVRSPPVERHRGGELHERVADVPEVAVVVEVLPDPRWRSRPTDRRQASGTSRRSRRPRPPCSRPSPEPRVPPEADRRPPMTAVGSRPARSSTRPHHRRGRGLAWRAGMRLPKRSRISSASIVGPAGSPDVAAAAPPPFRVAGAVPPRRPPRTSAPPTLAAVVSLVHDRPSRCNPGGHRPTPAVGAGHW